MQSSIGSAISAAQVASTRSAHRARRDTTLELMQPALPSEALQLALWSGHAWQDYCVYEERTSEQGTLQAHAQPVERTCEPSAEEVLNPARKPGCAQLRRVQHGHFPSNEKRNRDTVTPALHVHHEEVQRQTASSIQLGS
eukprot:1146267-Amphidinium_carterae.2